MVEVEDKIESLVLADHMGVKREISAGTRKIIFFYPKANTPGWIVEATGFQSNQDVFHKNDIDIYGVSADSVRAQRSFAEKQGITFPLFCDTEKIAIKAFGVWGKKKLYGREYEGINRSTFVLDEESHVTHVFTKVSPKKHQEELLNALGLKSTWCDFHRKHPS